MSRVTILGVPVDALTGQQAVVRIREYLASTAQHHVMTPNSEMLVAASKDPVFHALLNRASLNIADSAGMLWAARHTGQHLPERVTGVDTVQALCMELDARSPVFLLGAGEGVAAQAASILQQRNPQLTIAGAYAGSPRTEDALAIIKRINESGATLLLVAYGAPAQDMWIDEHLKELPGVRVAMGVGGTFDFITGKQQRAPLIVRNLHLEWLWRLVREPRRIGRIVNAVIIFPLLVWRNDKGNHGGNC